eukprot:291741_1
MSLTKNVISMLHDEDNGSIRNVIHSTNGAKTIGYKEPLVGGVDAYSYGYSLIIDGYSYDFLKNGYIQLKFLRPMFPNRNINIVLDKNDHKNSFSMNYIDENTQKMYIQSSGGNYVNNEFINNHCFKQYLNKTINDNEYNQLIDKQLLDTPLNKH